MQPIWKYGEIENVDDPHHSGQVQVRLFGIHDPTKEILKTEYLPWAQIMLPPTSSGLMGVGDSPTGIEVGSQCLCMVMDDSFTDIKVVQVWTARGEDFNDVTVLARGETDGIIRRKMNTKSSSDRIGTTWVEPSFSYDRVEYPNNKVFRTKSGHIQEFDDTPSEERIHIMHMNGSYFEMLPDGKCVNKSISHWYNVIGGDQNTLVVGDDRKRVKGSAVHNYSETMYVAASDQITLKSNSGILLRAGSTVEVKTDLMTIIGQLAVSEEIIVPKLIVKELEVGSIKASALEVGSLIQGTCAQALIAGTTKKPLQPQIPILKPKIKTPSSLTDSSGAETTKNANTDEIGKNGKTRVDNE